VVREERLKGIRRFELIAKDLRASVLEAETATFGDDFCLPTDLSAECMRQSDFSFRVWEIQQNALGRWNPTR
jgi:hypothetical protein